MNTQQKIKMIETLVAHYKAMNEQADAMRKLFGIQADCDAMNPFWSAFDGYVNAVSECVGDESSRWIAWFIWDNQCGDRVMKAGFKGRMRPVKTVKQLVKLIEAYE